MLTLAYLTHIMTFYFILKWIPKIVVDMGYAPSAAAVVVLIALVMALQHHGATYEPDTGACAGGPCRGGLVKIELLEHGGVVYWRSQYNLKPVEF